MKKIHTILIISFLILPVLGFSEETSMETLIEKDGRYYLINSEKPFHGYVTGSQTGQLLNGIKDGKWKGYYENGKILWEGEYNLGTITKWKEFHSNGKIFAKGNYKNGKKNGKWSIYSKTETLIAEEFYENGNIVETKIFK